jgi:hypothetical protein
MFDPAKLTERAPETDNFSPREIIRRAVDAFTPERAVSILFQTQSTPLLCKVEGRR